MNEKYPVLSTLKKMISNVTNLNRTIYVYFIFYTLATAIYPFFAIILPKLLITELTREATDSLNRILFITGGFFLAAGFVGFLKSFLLNYAYPEITKLRINYIRDIFEKIVGVDYKHMEDATFFEKNNRAMEATSSNDNGVEGVYHKLFEIPAIFLSILILTIFIGRLSIFILIGLLVNVGISIWIRRSVHNYQYSLKEALAHEERKKRYYFNTTHDFGYGKDIRLYQFRDQILDNYTNDVNKYIGIHKKIKNRELQLSFLDLGCLFISNGLTYGFLIYMVVNGMSIADFSMYITAVTSLSLLLNKGSEEFTFIINEGQYVHDFYEFLEKDLGEAGGEKLREEDTLEIVFDKVSFKYPGTDHYIIKDLDFTIHKGEKLAIVGINGAGKSTLVKLMTRLFDVTEGEIRINGIPIKNFNKKELYAMFSVVFQDINILAFSVSENIACSIEQINEDKVEHAIEKVGLLEKISQLPKKFNHPMLKVIEEDGVEFSGGESQKLAIARALYKDGNMVIMDEPTAALDALAEAEIYENFSELVKGKTAVYISHRLASTKFCDKIALFDKDGLKEYGNHEELMKEQGAYYKMFTIQGKYYKEEGVMNG